MRNHIAIIHRPGANGLVRMRQQLQFRAWEQGGGQSYFWRQTPDIMDACMHESLPAGLLEPARFRGFRRSGSGPVRSGLEPGRTGL